MSDSLSARKLGAGVVDDINAAIGYKGDVYSGSMGVDDIKSDVDAYNLYYRMKGCKDGDIWGTMTEYNIGVGDGSINGSTIKKKMLLRKVHKEKSWSNSFL